MADDDFYSGEMKLVEHNDIRQKGYVQCFLNFKTLG